MFYINFSQNRSLIKSQCEQFLVENNKQPETISFKDACIATQNYRHALGLDSYSHAIFIGFPNEIDVTAEDCNGRTTTYTIHGYWLFNGISDNEIVFISVPAILDSNRRYQPLLPTGDCDQNPVGLEMRKERPCPPPPPCPEDSELTRDSIFLGRFPPPPPTS